jgi:hypothetical protein
MFFYYISQKITIWKISHFFEDPFRTTLSYKAAHKVVLVWVSNCEVLKESRMVLKNSIFWDIVAYSPLKNQPKFQSKTSPSSSGSKNKPSKKPDLLDLVSRFSVLAYFSTLKMEGTPCSETSIDSQCITRSYSLEDRTLHNNRCENLKSYWYYWRQKIMKGWRNVMTFKFCYMKICLGLLVQRGFTGINTQNNTGTRGYVSLFPFRIREIEYKSQIAIKE